MNVSEVSTRDRYFLFSVWNINTIYKSVIEEIKIWVVKKLFNKPEFQKLASFGKSERFYEFLVQYSSLRMKILEKVFSS